MKNIIIPVDFSAASENAANYAAEMARFYDARLFLYHAYMLPLGLPEYGYPFITAGELQTESDYELNEMVNRIRANTSQKIAIETMAEMNLLHDGLPAFCAEKKADMVVMALTGKDALTRLVVGSNTIKAIHHLKYPVLVVPKDAVFKPIHRIGFACDYKQVRETTPLAQLKSMVQLFNAGLHVINVDWHNRHFKPDTPLEQFDMHMFLVDLDVKYHNLESEDVSAALNSFAKEEYIDLLIAIPKKHNLVEKLFTRSKTQDLLFHTNLPVLCMHE